MKKFVMLDSHTLPDADFHQEKELLAEHNIECVLAKCKTEEEVIACAQDADCIGDNYFRIDGALLDKLPNCKAIIRSMLTPAPNVESGSAIFLNTALLMSPLIRWR